MIHSRLLLIAAGAALAGATTPAIANGASGHSGSWTGPRPGAQMPGTVGNWGSHRWGPRQNGRWFAGWGAPGGWGAYRRPVYGYVLPRYWVSPNYYIANYGAYGLPAPAYGYGWSRYYDDAVMTDRYGRVYDHRSNLDWDRYEGGYAPDDGYYDAPRRDNGVGGAAIGAVVGGVAGMAIDKAEDAPRHSAPPRRRPGAAYDEGYGYADDSVTSSNEYEGRWTGTWTTDDGRKVSGTYDGRFEGDVRGAGVDYDAPPYGVAPHWGAGPMPGPGGGYVSGGYYYPAPIVTTVTVEPKVTTTTTTSYVTEKVRYRPSVRRKTVRSCRCK